MDYVGKTVEEVMNMVGSKEMVLPSIQRKYVWSDEKIIKLFDSLMLDYPIGTFLIWRLKRNAAVSKGLILYDFLKTISDYDGLNNEKLSDGLPGTSEYINIVLDGQQRLTALYVGLYGNVVRHKWHHNWTDLDSFTKKELFINLSKDPRVGNEDDDTKYEFDFLDSSVVKSFSRIEGKLWFKVKDIIPIADNHNLIKLIMSNNLNEVEEGNLSKLFSTFKKVANQTTIHYYEIDERMNLEEILNIFVRINDGGVKLSKTDLLFSTIVSNWEEGREKIEELIETINNKGQHFDFNTDFIMRACLYLHCESSELKIENLTHNNIETIKEKWDKISKTIIHCVDKLVDFGFCSKTIISNNVIMPIIYYYYNDWKDTSEVDEEIRKFLIIAQINSLFSSSSNTVLSRLKRYLDDNADELKKNGFKLALFEDLRFGDIQKLKVTSDTIGEMLEYKKGSSQAFMVLSILYPNMKFSQIVFHQDHMYPRNGFKVKTLKKEVQGISNETIDEWNNIKDMIPNLQLLEGGENEGKNDEALDIWLDKKLPDGTTNKDHVKYLPILDDNKPYKIQYFDEFYEKRSKLMEEQLKSIFKI